MSEQNSGDQAGCVTMAKWGMTASVAAFLQVVLFNPGFGVALPLMREALWPVAIRVAGLLVMVLAPTGIVLSAISLCTCTLEARKRVLFPALTGLFVGLLMGIPFAYGFLHGGSSKIARTHASEALPVSGPNAPAVQGTTEPAKAAAPPQAGVFIPAPQRADMVHDSRRNRLYITAGDSLLQYQMESKTFLPPIVLGGNLRGLDISTDGDWLAVADESVDGRQIWVYMVDLRNQSNQRVNFAADMQESGTYSVAFGEDGGVWISSSLKGSGFTPLRKYTPATRTTLTLRSVSQNTMLSASADRKTIAFAEASLTPGAYGQFPCRATQLPKPAQAATFVYEIGISRDGTQVAAPTYNQVLILGSNASGLPDRACLGVVYHPQRDFMFLTRSDSSIVAAYESRNFGKAKELDFGSKFHWAGGNAFEEGRLRISRDGALLFCSVAGGIRCMETGL